MKTLAPEMGFGCSGSMAQGVWMPHNSEVAISTACYYGIAIIACSCLMCQCLKLHRDSNFLPANLA